MTWIPELSSTASSTTSSTSDASTGSTTTGVHTGDTLGFPATGKRIDAVSANIGRFRDGKAVEHWSEQGMAAMLIQLGVLPAPASV